MINIDQLRVLRDSIFRAQLAEVEAEIDAAIQNLNAQGVLEYIYETAALNQGQADWIVERYRSGGYTVHTEIVDVGGTPAVRYTFSW